MADGMIDWGAVSPTKTKAKKIDKRPSFETLERINLKRDNVKELNFRPIYKPFLYLEYWNVDDPTKIRYGDNYYVINNHYGRSHQRLTELGYPDAAPYKLRMRAIVSFLIIDRADDQIKILELPWGASFLMGQFATKYDVNLGGKNGVDFTITDMSDDNQEKYAVDADSAETTPFTMDEKQRIKDLLEDRVDAMSDMYFRRFLDIEPLLKGLNLDPFEEEIEEEVEEEVEPEPKAKIAITVPQMDEDKYKPFMPTVTDDVLKNLRILVNSKEYDRFLSREMDMQELVNMDVFMIRSQMELEYRENGLPFCERFVNKIKSDYSKIVDSVEEDDFEIKLDLI